MPHVIPMHGSVCSRKTSVYLHPVTELWRTHMHQRWPSRRCIKDAWSSCHTIHVAHHGWKPPDRGLNFGVQRWEQRARANSARHSYFLRWLWRIFTSDTYLKIILSYGVKKWKQRKIDVKTTSCRCFGKYNKIWRR